MIWLYLFLPVVILGGVAMYFDKKHGSSAPTEEQLRGKIKEYPPEHHNSNGPDNFGP